MTAREVSKARVLLINKYFRLVLICTCLTLLVTVFLLSGAAADVFDFGGSSEKFKGGGDDTPPRCSVGIPRAADAPFFITVDCADDETDDEDVRTEIWILRNGANRFRLVEAYLGFPVSLQVDTAILQVGEFSEGLPAGFRIRAIDRAGNSTTSNGLLVLQQDNRVDQCDLSIVTEATESDGDTTGVPAMTVLVDNALVTTTQSSTTTFSITTTTSANAAPCEIQSICNNGDQVTFSSSVILGDGDSATGTIAIAPSATMADLTGSATIEDSVLTLLDLSGTTTIDGAAATITLTCSQ